ncbi:MAG: hypothetical protein QXJ93_00260 [Candidatus Rehaiarchaeum fermentans]|nr:hypothetical protein [Candidatus Rehaiarchaeum fermentans]
MISVHYGEIALKNRNRHLFVKDLLDSLLYVTGGHPKDIGGRIILDEGDISFLSLVPGVSWYGDTFLFKEISEVEAFLLSKGKKFDIEVRRIDKSLPFTSLDVKKKLLYLTDKNGERARIEIFKDKILVTLNIKKGIGGLPINKNNKILHLFSGGVDSTLAAFQLMKRGANVDLLHVYAVSEDFALKGKIGKIAAFFSNIKPIRLYLAPFDYFYSKFLALDTKYEIVLFKHFLLLLADRFDEYLAISNGDSLSQVSSQTLPNIRSVNYGITKPILRPLISFNKEEIIDLSKKLGFYDLTVENYKDCCSIISRNNTAKSNLNKLIELEEKINMKEIVDNTFSRTRMFIFEKGKLKQNY